MSRLSPVVRVVVVALGILAAANLVALAAALVWLLGTDRMDAERFGRLKTLVLTPIAVEQATLDQVESERRAETAATIERARPSMPPRTAAERSEAIDRAIDQSEIRRRLIEEQARLLGRSLEERLEALREQTAAFERRDAERRAAIADDEAIRSSVQFRKTLALLDGAPPRQAKEWLLELLRSGRRDEAVRYLDAMSRYAASRVMRELKSAEEASLAADLLESIRRRTSHDDASP